jgi:hypothetical protein
MASNKIIRFGPVALTSAYTRNIVNCAIVDLTGPTGYTQTQPYLIIRHIRIVNVTATAATFRMFVGASGANLAGTEFMGYNTTVPANSYIDWYGTLRLDSTDFLVGGASAAATLTFQAEGEIGIA